MNVKGISSDHRKSWMQVRCCGFPLFCIIKKKWLSYYACLWRFMIFVVGFVMKINFIWNDQNIMMVTYGRISPQFLGMTVYFKNIFCLYENTHLHILFWKVCGHKNIFGSICPGFVSLPKYKEFKLFMELTALKKINIYHKCTVCGFHRELLSLLSYQLTVFTMHTSFTPCSHTGWTLFHTNNSSVHKVYC